MSPWSGSTGPPILGRAVSGSRSCFGWATMGFLQLLACGVGLGGQEPDGFPHVRGAYFGEPPPGLVPRLFAPGIASTDLGDDWPPLFTPDGTEVLLRVVAPKGDGSVVGILMSSVRVQGVWQPPEPLWFSNEFLEVEGFPALALDGASLFVSTAREEWTGEGDPDRDIWVFQREARGWGEPTRVGPSVNSDLHDLITAVGPDGTLYFDREPREGSWYSRSYLARPDSGGGYQVPELITDSSETPGQFQKYAIAPDGSYRVLTGTHPTRGFDLYVSFREPSGSWGAPVNLESVNSNRSDKFPALSHDGRFLFFASRRTPLGEIPPRYWPLPGVQSAPDGNQVDVFWVSTEVIERMRPR